MADCKQILRLRAEGVSQRGIADVLGCSRNTVAAVFAAANAAGVGFGEVADLGADEVRHLLLPEPAKAVSDRVTPDFEHVHRELARPSVTLLLLWNEYVAGCRAAGGVPYRYSFFNEQYRRWVAATGASMHVQRSPGESIEVDWAGDAMSFADPLTGARADAWLFVAALSFSAYAYVEAFTDMTLGSWIDAHVHAFEAFGGTARLLVPDNLRTGVSRSDRYEPALNPAYARLAEHYGTAIVPARVRKPRDKPVVEGSVRFVANQVAAVLRDRRFVGLAELNEAIFDEVANINARPFQKREDSRRIVFVRDEKPLLRPLPPVRFELADLRKAKPGPNYHLLTELEKMFPQVTWRFAGRCAMVPDRDRGRGCDTGPGRAGRARCRIAAGDRQRVGAVPARRPGRGRGDGGGRVVRGPAGRRPVGGHAALIRHGPAAVVPVPVGSRNRVEPGDPQGGT